MLATELAAVETVETHTLTCPIPQCGALGLSEEFHVDLTSKRANDEFWNLSQEADQQAFVELQQMGRPQFIIGSPPCGDFSSLLSTPPSAEDGGGHIDAAAVYQRQLEMCKHFVHQHPSGSFNRNADSMRVLAAESRVHLVTGPQCRWKLKDQTSGVRIGYIRRKTTWMTSSLVLAQAMKSGAWQQCSHRHLVLQHATIAGILPPKLVVAVLESLHKQMVLDGATNRGLRSISTR